MDEWMKTVEADLRVRSHAGALAGKLTDKLRGPSVKLRRTPKVLKATV